jgi:hypothetical protein
LVAFSNGGTVLANAKIEDKFTDSFGIYDLKSFLSLTSLIVEPEINTDTADSHVVISGNGSKFKFFVADEKLIKKPLKSELALPKPDLSFSLDQSTLDQVLRAASVLTIDTVTIFSEDNGLFFGVADPKIKNSDSFSVRLADYDGPALKLVISISKLTLLPGTYKVEVSHSTAQIMIQFTNESRDLRYWTAPESNSKVG